MNYEQKTEATIEDWKSDITAQLTGDQGDDYETRAISKGRRYLVGKTGFFPNGDRAFDQMKRAGLLVLGGGGGKNARWSLTAEEDRVESNRQDAREKREVLRRTKRDGELRKIVVGLADLPSDASLLDALRTAYEAGRDS